MLTNRFCLYARRCPQAASLNAGSTSGRGLWKASSAETTGLTLRLGPHHGGGVSLTAGQAAAFEGAIEDSQAAAPPHEWTTIRVDLWELHRREPFAIRSLSLGATGGGGLFDNIRLARGPADLN